MKKILFLSLSLVVSIAGCQKKRIMNFSLKILHFIAIQYMN